MKPEKPKRPKNDAEQAAVARKISRKVLDEPLPSWGREQRVSVFREASGLIRIVRGGELAIVCAPDVAPDDFATLQDFRRFIMRLIDLLEEQAMIAEWTHPLAKFDVDLNRKRADEGAKAGRKSAKRERSAVEQQVRASLRRKEDPKTRAAAWAQEYGYSKRQIRNIIEKVRAE